MTPQAVIGAQRLFQIDRPQFCQASGLDQRFSGNIKCELAGIQIQGGHRHAGAIKRNAVAQTHIVKVVGRTFYGHAFAVIQRAAQGVDGGDAADARDDSCKHAVIFAAIWLLSRSAGSPILVFSGVNVALKLVPSWNTGQNPQVRSDHLRSFESKLNG